MECRLRGERVEPFAFYRVLGVRDLLTACVLVNRSRGTDAYALTHPPSLAHYPLCTRRTIGYPPAIFRKTLALSILSHRCFTVAASISRDEGPAPGFDGPQTATPSDDARRKVNRQQTPSGPRKSDLNEARRNIQKQT